MSKKPGPVDLAEVGVLFGDPARVAMLVALSHGRALPAGEIARRAGVAPAPATSHLRRLVDAGLVQVTVQARHRYHELAGPPVSANLQALARLAPPIPVTSWRQHREQSNLAEERTCDDHLAGRRGVKLRDRLLAAGALQSTGGEDHTLTAPGQRLIADLGIDLDRFRSGRRVFARSCLDWPQRRPHLAGPLPSATTGTFLARGRLKRSTGRGLRVTTDYDQHLDRWLTATRSPKTTHQHPMTATCRGWIPYRHKPPDNA